MSDIALSIVFFGIIYAVFKYIGKDNSINMAFFSLRDDLTSYIPSIRRLGFCALFYILTVYRHKILAFLYVFGDYVDLLFYILLWLIFLSVIVSIDEIGTTYNNRKKEKLHKDWCKSSSIKQ